MEAKDSKKKTIITAVALGQLTLAIAVTIYGAFTKKFTGRKSDLLIAASLLLFWVLMDLAEPFLLRRFDGITPRQKSAYVRFILLDFAGLAGLAYFLFSMGQAGNNAIFGAVIYAVTIKPKRDSQDIFYSLVKPEEEDAPGAEEEPVVQDGTAALEEEPIAQEDAAGTEDETIAQDDAAAAKDEPIARDDASDIKE